MPATLSFLLATVIATSLGCSLALLAPQPASAPLSRDESAPQAITSGATIRLPPVVTNLAQPETAWIRLEGIGLTTSAPAPDREQLAAAIADDVLAHLRTLSLREIEGSSGLRALREDLGERARIRTGDAVREILIHGLVVQ